MFGLISPCSAKADFGRGNKKFEPMLTRRTKAYSSFGSR